VVTQVQLAQLDQPVLLVLLQLSLLVQPQLEQRDLALASLTQEPAQLPYLTSQFLLVPQVPQVPQDQPVRQGLKAHLALLQ
jgi:hypothetical protein